MPFGISMPRPPRTQSRKASSMRCCRMFGCASRAALHAASAMSLAWFAAKQVKQGRPAVGRLSSREPLSRYAQLGQGIHVERLHSYSKRHDQWIDVIVEDGRAPVADQVAARMDVRAWFATLSRRTRQIAKDLAYGCSTSEVAKKHGVTAGRVSQLRRELYDAWRVFQGEALTSPAVGGQDAEVTVQAR